MKRGDFDVVVTRGAYRVCKADRRRERLHQRFSDAEANAIHLTAAQPGSVFIITQEVARVQVANGTPVEPAPTFFSSDADREKFFAGKRWEGLRSSWLLDLPEPYRSYIIHIEKRVFAEQGRTSQQALRAQMAERRERDAAVATSLLKRRVAELESLVA